MRMVRRASLTIKCADCGGGYPAALDRDPEHVMGPFEEVTFSERSYVYGERQGCTGCFGRLVDEATGEIFMRPGWRKDVH